MLISSPFTQGKKGKWGGQTPPHTPRRGGARPPPAPPPYVTGHAPRRHLGCGWAGAKMAGPNHFYTFIFQLKTATSQQRGGDFKTI